MSAYNPRMAGTASVKAEPTTTAISYTAQASVAPLPAMLRLKADAPGKVASVAGPKLVSTSAMNIQLHATSAAVALQAAAAEERANVRFADAERAQLAARVALAADPEVLLQIPRLKETLRALDSEMHSTASSDIDKRLQMHERILQLQGAQLSKVQLAYEQTARSVGQIMDTQALHGQLHEAAGRAVIATEAAGRELRAKNELHSRLLEVAGRQVLNTDAATQGLLETSALHSRLHKASAASVLGLEDSVEQLHARSALSTQVHAASVAKLRGVEGHVRELAETSALHSEVHHAGGQGVLALREDVRRLAATSALHSEVHHAGGEGVLALRKAVDGLHVQGELHAELHQATGAGVLQLQAQGDLHTRMHHAVNDALKAAETVGAPAGVNDALKAAKGAADALLAVGAGGAGKAAADELLRLRHARTEERLDALAAENAQLRAAVGKHSEMHASQAQIMAGLAPLAAGGAHATVRTHGVRHACAGAMCTDASCRCATCEEAKRVGASATPAQRHSNMLAQLEGDIKAANRRPKRGH